MSTRARLPLVVYVRSVKCDAVLFNFHTDRSNIKGGGQSIYLLWK